MTVALGVDEVVFDDAMGCHARPEPCNNSLPCSSFRRLGVRVSTGPSADRELERRRCRELVPCADNCIEFRTVSRQNYQGEGRMKEQHGIDGTAASSYPKGHDHFTALKPILSY